MPGHLELKKDAPNGETLRGAGSSRFVYGALTLFGRPSHAVPLRSSLASLRSFYPDPSIGLGSSLFARRYSGNHFCFLFLRLLREPRERSEREPETVCLQEVGVR